MEIKSISDYDIKNGDLNGPYYTKPIPEFKFALREYLKDDKRFLPTRATPGSCGWDICAAQENREPIIIRPGKYVKIPLGFRTIFPKGWWLECEPRSSTFIKKSLHCLTGKLDNDWRGWSALCAQYIPDVSSLGNDLVIEFGEKIGQLIPVKLQEMNITHISNDEFEKICKEEINERGDKGFGSTSK
jgi:dUTPase